MSPLDGYRDHPEILAFIERAGGRLLESLLAGTPREAPMLTYGSPEDHARALADGVGLPLVEHEPAHATEALLEAVETILERAVRSEHPRFFNQSWAGADPVAVLGDWLGARLNTTAATYEMAPLFTLMDDAILGRMAELAGWATPRRALRTAPGAHGLFTPGGATSNLYAVHLARSWKAPEALETGRAPPLVGFTSAQSHYSMEKAFMMTGLGRSQLVQVPCDAWGRMKVDALAAAIEDARARGGVPFLVNATAGTTVTGAFDPLEPIARLAKDHGLWLHVDGSLGGSVLFSERERGRLAGLEHAHSFAWNPHKLMGITQQCSVLLLRDGSALRPAFATGAGYIFQTDKNDAELDLGDLTLQCGRRADGLKLWLTWKARGEAWFGRRIERALDLAARLEGAIVEDPRFALAHPRSFSNVGFWWVPPKMRPLPPEPGPAAMKRLGTYPRPIKDRLQREGSLMLGYQALGALPSFFRLLVMSPDVTWKDLEASLELIDRHGLATLPVDGAVAP